LFFSFFKAVAAGAHGVVESEVFFRSLIILTPR